MNYLGQWSNLTLVRQDGTTRLAADVLRDVPYVIFLFGASWSGETQTFLPVLEQFYERHHTAKGFEVIYISRDYNRSDMMRGFLAAQHNRAAPAATQLLRRRPTAVPAPDGVGRVSSGPSRAEDLGGGEAGDGTPPPPPPPSPPGSHTPPPSSTPPPLKRVAELAPAKSTNSFSGAAVSATVTLEGRCGDLCTAEGYSGGIWAVPYDHVGTVGVPLLYHLRVFTYPGVIVCRNLPLHPSTVPALLAGPTMPAAANAPRRRELTPRIAERVCQPDVITITGRFMMESGDASGENFPWEHMGSSVRFAALFFFAIAGAVLVVVLSIVLPAVATLRHARRATAASRSSS